MLHPSYVELMEAVNKNADNGGEPVVTSRYSLVIAAAKRARQLIDNRDPEIIEDHGRKPLSIAVDELMSGAVRILPPDNDEIDLEENAISAEASLYGSSLDTDDEDDQEETKYDEDSDESSEDYDRDEDPEDDQDADNDGSEEEDGSEEDGQA